MKKILIIIVIIVFVFISFIFLFKIQDKNRKNIIVNDKLLIIPKIELYDLEGEVIKLHEKVNNQKVIIVYFDINCDLCHIEAKEFYRLQGQFKDCSVIFISNNKKEEINEFIMINDLESSDFIFLIDKDYKLITTYNILEVPCMLLYIDNKLYKSYKGAIRVEQIIEDKSDKQD